MWQAALAQEGRRSGGARAQRFRATLRSPTSLTLLAEDDGDLVGLLVAELTGAALRLTEVAVLPGRQRRGVGSALVQSLLTRFDAVQAEPHPFLARLDLPGLLLRS